MPARFARIITCVVALIAATGCRPYRSRAFVADEQPVRFESWRIYVNIGVPGANPPATNELYNVSVVAWTLPGDVYRGDANEFRPTAYDANLKSLRLFRLDGTNIVELPLPLPSRGANDHPNRLVQRAYGSREIPPGVNELKAEVTMTFQHRDTGETELKVFSLRMIKQERTKIAPMLD